MVSPSLQKKLPQKGETRKRKISNLSNESTVGSSKRERVDPKISKRKKHVLSESDDKHEELRRTESMDSDSEATDDSVYEIEKILAKRVDDDGCVYYTVRWKNYPPEDDSEEPESNVDAPQLIREFEQEQQRLQERSSEKDTLSSQLSAPPRSRRPTSTLPKKVVNKNVAKTTEKGSTALPGEMSASANPPLQKSPQKQPGQIDTVDTVVKSPLKQNVPDVFTSQTSVKKLPSVHDTDGSNNKQQTSASITSCLDPGTLAISKESTFTTVTSIRRGSANSSSVKASLPNKKQINDKIKSKTNEQTAMATPSQPQDNRMSNEEASTVTSASLTQQEANPSVTKTIQKDGKPKVIQSLQCTSTTNTNDDNNSQISEIQIDIIKREMDEEENANQREEEHWRREKEQKRLESLAERMQNAEKKERLEAQKSARASKETEQIYDPRAAPSSSNNDEIFDPRAVKNDEASTESPLPSQNPPLPPCLLDRGIKIEKILKLFYVKEELVGMCQYKNCLLLQIVPVKKIKEVDPMALIKAYEALYWDES